MSTITAPISRQQSSRPVPPLQSGDRLTRVEFERRYTAMPPGTRAELIEGVVQVLPSPVNDGYHGVPHFDLIGVLAAYCALTPGTRGGDNSSVRLDTDNEPQPDIYLRILPECGGQCRWDADKWLEGAPELIAEIAASSASHDLHAKQNAYRRNNVREYIVWRTYDEAIDWFVLREGRYEKHVPGDDGIHRSEVFPGLWLDLKALLAGDMARVFQGIQQGVASAEHTAFVEKLRQSIKK